MNVKNYTLFGSFGHLHCKLLLLFSFSFCLPFHVQADVLTLSCPDDLVVQLSPGDCNASVSFDTLVWSSTQTLNDTVFFPPSGTTFEIGTNTVTLAVTDIGGNLETCTFTVQINEFFPAELICEQNVEISLNGQCTREIFPQEFLQMDSTGCLSNYEVVRITSGGIAISPIISADDVTSTFLVAVSHTGNGMQCLTQVTLTGGTPPAISCPPNANISCNQPVDVSITGLPTLTGCYQSNVNYVFTDEMTSTSCPDSVAFQITRTWVSTDPFGKKDTCIQLITGYRFDINLVEFPADFDGTVNPPLQCSDSLTITELTDPTLIGEPTYLGYSAGSNSDCRITSSFNDKVTNICGGSYEIERSWTVVKICAPPAVIRDTQYINVVDSVGPQFEVPDSIFVSLSSQCADTILLPPAENIRECSSYEIEIRSPWDTLNTNGGWIDLVSASGDFSIIYEMTDLCGNVTADTVTLVFGNETLVSCPPDVTINCDYYFDTLVTAVILGDEEILNQLGAPIFPSNCEFGFTETDSLVVSSCGNGMVFRNMVSGDSSAQTCSQIVHVEHLSDFDVIFPEDVTTCIHPDSINLGMPIVAGESCENIFVIPTDIIVPGDVSGCYTIERKWVISNSCAYTGVNSFDDTELAERHFSDGGDGVIEYTQIIDVNISDGPIFPIGCEIPDLYLPAGSCELTIPAPVPVVSECGGVDLFMGGALGSVVGAEVSIGLGNHGVTYTAIDNCGRSGTCSTFFEVFDTVAPTFECSPQMVELQFSNPPMFDLSASDFVLSGNDNCGMVTYAFSEDESNTDTIFDCCSLGVFPLEVWAIDESGNTSSCSTFVILDDPSSLCNCDFFLAGVIATESGAGIVNVEVDISPTSGTAYLVSTGVGGSYSTPFSPGQDYAITPSKDINPLNGVSTFDALLITQHILGNQLFTSPYQLIAADFNNSGSVSTFDLLEIRKLVLNITTEIPNNTSWRFVPADFQFPNPQDPFDSGWPESIMINNSSGNLLNLDFIGIKVGDVNGSASTED